MSRTGGRRVEDVVILRRRTERVSPLHGCFSARHRRPAHRAAGRAARLAAEELPRRRVYEATGLEPGLPRARAHRRAARPCSRCATTRRTSTRPRSRSSTASASRSRWSTSRLSSDVFERAGVDVAVNPRLLTAEEIVRFAHDPRTQQVAMLEGDRYEILDVITRPESPLVGQRFRDLPALRARFWKKFAAASELELIRSSACRVIRGAPPRRAATRARVSVRRSRTASSPQSPISRTCTSTLSAMEAATDASAASGRGMIGALVSVRAACAG